MSIAQVRALIPDTEAAFDGQTLFSDTEITTYLEIAGGNVLRAAAYAMIAVGNSEALISKVITTQDLSTDGSKVADAFRKGAETFLRRADEIERRESSFFTIIDFPSGYEKPELTEWNWAPYEP